MLWYYTLSYTESTLWLIYNFPNRQIKTISNKEIENKYYETLHGY